MVCKKVVVRDVNGLHLQPAVNIVMACQGMDSKVMIRKGGSSANAGSIIELLLLGVESGSEVEIVAEGKEEEIAVRRITGVFE